jgi:hypothetical protein
MTNGYPDDLLELAQHLASLEPTNPRQACLRRSVSTAYYALFHLLISEATSNWIRPELSSALPLGRLFEHGKMKSASQKKRSELEAHFKKNPPPSPDLVPFRHLHRVTNVFIQVQQKREEADYDTGKEWSQTDVRNPDKCCSGGVRKLEDDSRGASCTGLSGLALGHKTAFRMTSNT